MAVLIAPFGSRIMSQVRFAISPARSPALADSSTMTRLRMGLRVPEGVDEEVLKVVFRQYFRLLPRHELLRRLMIVSIHQTLVDNVISLSVSNGMSPLIPPRGGS